jgi:hypothetical protein
MRISDGIAAFARSRPTNAIRPRPPLRRSFLLVYILLNPEIIETRYRVFFQSASTLPCLVKNDDLPALLTAIGSKEKSGIGFTV